MRTSPLRRGYSGWVDAGLIAIQLLLLRFVMQLEPDDQLMSLAEGGILLLPGSLVLLVLGTYSLRRSSWVRGSIGFLLGLIGLFIGSGSLYLRTL